MSKNKTIIVIFSAIALIALLTSTFISQKKPTSQGGIPNPTSIPAPPTIINTRKLNISGVETNDFTTSPVSSTAEGNVTFAETQDYQITYLPAYSLFIINVFTTDSSARHAAEAEFLNKLGITADKACKLTVRVGQRYSTDLPETQNDRLSFCQ